MKRQPEKSYREKLQAATAGRIPRTRRVRDPLPNITSMGEDGIDHINIGSGAATQLEMLHRFTDLCAETCRQREENETHSTQAIIKRINRYIEDNVENYDLSLTALARMTGFNPSYLSRFYRINTGKKLSDQIDEAKLQHAKKLIAQGELVKNVAERTGFASPSAFILFFKRNTGVTPRQYFESKNKS